MSKYGSWGNYPAVNQQGRALKNRFAGLPQSEQHLLPYGLGRSYGDSCLNSSGGVLSSENLNHFIHFDKDSGILTVEAGISLADIITAVMPYGWFLPVTPGTKFVTIAGAIANDVHGKNHHVAGSFANHVLEFELLRSDGTRLLCSEAENTEWFTATVGGLGLTGFITWAKLQLKPVSSRFIETESIKYNHLNDFFTLSEDSSEDFEYTVAWIDCSAQGDKLGRGHFIRGNHAQVNDLAPRQSVFDQGKLAVPLMPPISLINSLSLKAFNMAYYNRQRAEQLDSLTHFDPFFYPLDGIHHWNRIYGKKGFVQYQCVIPTVNSQTAIKALLESISRSGQGSFLVVLKMMGDIASKGLLSFSSEGATLAIDFPFLGDKTLGLLSQLDDIVLQAGGKLYPAKDARMSAELFQTSYSRWEELEAKRDPKILSDFWRRVTGSEN